MEPFGGAVFADGHFALGLFDVSLAFALIGAIFLTASILLQLGRTRRTDPAARRPHVNIWAPKVIFLSAVGIAITLLLVGGIIQVAGHHFGAAAYDLLVGWAFIVVFFRHRGIALAIMVPGCLLAWAGPIALVRPTLIGVTVSLTSVAALSMLCLWLTRKLPHSTRRDFLKLFDRDPM